MGDEFWQSFGKLETYLKIGFVVATYRLWGPVLKAIVRELRIAADTPRGSLTEDVPPPPVPRAPGEDPWISVPLAAHRSRTASPPQPRGAGRVPGRVGKSQRGAFRPAGKSRSSF